MGGSMTAPDLHAKARDLMQTRIVAVTRDYGARDISILIQSGNFSGVPVIDPGNRLVGVVTEFDVLKAILAKKDLQALKAGDIMTADPITVEETTTAEDIVKHMLIHQIIRIPVVRDGKLLGIISRTDLLNHFVATNIINVYGA
jgi:CBS domain-containing protein